MVTLAKLSYFARHRRSGGRDWELISKTHQGPRLKPQQKSECTVAI